MATERLARCWRPRDPHDSADALLEIKSGEGGEESALFAGDLFRMYSRYAEARGWKVEVLDSTESDLGGIKSLTMAVKGPASAGPDASPYGVLKFEGGVHRVQRVPVTESQGRIHTSAAGVLVMPDVEDDSDLEVSEDDLRVDVYRSSGKGGQGVNTTDSAVRLTHLPTGLVVTCQNERSQLQNKASALRILKARLAALAEEQAAAEASSARKSQVRTVDRSERIRTYNFPENRIADHRIGYKAYNLDAVLAGDLGDVIAALQAADLAERLGCRRCLSPASSAVVARAPRGGLGTEARGAHAAGPRPRRRARRGSCCSPSVADAAAGARLEDARRAARRGGARCSTSRAWRRSARSSSRSAPACSSRARRPR